MGERRANMTANCRRPTTQWLAESDGFLVDLDGTLIAGKRVLPGAADLLKAMDGRFVIVSNNSTDHAAALADTLRRRGLPVSPRQVLLAGEVAVRWIAEHRPGATLMILGSDALTQLARELGLSPAESGPEIVLLGRDKRFSYRRLCRAANALREGAVLMVTNTDANHPGTGANVVVPETGSLMQALVTCSGVSPAIIFGKPEPAMLREGLRRLGIGPETATMIGDNPDTDIPGAHRLGIRCLLLGSAPGSHARTPAELLRHHASGAVHAAWPTA